MEENFVNMEEHFTYMEDHSEKHVCACVFSVFRAVKVMDRYNLSGLMEQAQNSDSKTHVKK